MGTNLIRAMLLASASAAVAVTAMPTAAYAQEASYQIDIPAQSMGSALRALGRATKRNILFDEAAVRGKRSAAVSGRMTAREALERLVSGSGLVISSNARGLVVQAGNGGGSAGGSAEVHGTVTDETTGRRLAGALVRLLPSNQTAVTDDQGNYRFFGVPGGDIRVSVSFLGLTTQVQDVTVGGGQGIDVDFMMGTGAEIVVYGTKSARSLALNKERSSDNSTTVISSDMIGQFNGTTISDALRRAPGIAFERDDNTGDGTNVIVRGLPSAYNQVLINGQQLPVGSGTDRNPNLNNILAGAISKVTISKTLLPSQDSAGTGGLIEIETTSPLDRPKRYASFGAERLWRGKGFGDEYLLSGRLSAKFADNFGVSVGYQRREQTVFNFGYRVASLFPEYLPLDAQGQPIQQLDYVDPRTSFPFERSPGAADIYPGLNINGTKTHSKTDSWTANLEWEPFDGTNWKLDYLTSKRQADSQFFNYSVGLFGFYSPTPIPALDGEVRFARTGLFASRSVSFGASETSDITHSATFRGTSEFGPLTFNYQGGYSQASARTPTAYNGSFGALNAPGAPPFSPSLALPEATNPNTGRLSSFFGPLIGKRVPQLLLNSEGLALVNDPSTFGLTGLSSGGLKGRSAIKSAELSAKYDLSNWIIDYIQAGILFNGNKSRSQAIDPIFYSVPFSPTYPNYPTAGDLGVRFGDIGFANILGNTSTLQIPSFQSFADFIGRVPQLAADGVYFTPFTDIDAPPTDTREDEFAAYVEAKVEIGKFSAVGGLRYSQFSVKSDFLRRAVLIREDGSQDLEFGAANTSFATEKATQRIWLPRLLLNYRPTDDTVIRAGYYSTTARPQLALLSQTQDITLSLYPFDGPNANQPSLRISKGNPDLKPSSVHNFDISLERYIGSVGAIKLAGYFKLFRNLVESASTSGFDVLDGVVLPDDPLFRNLPADIFIAGTRPFNNKGTAKAWGVEASIERQLDFVPWTKGLGVYANFTYSGSSKTQPFSWLYSPIYDADGNLVGREQVDFEFKGVPFDGSPKHSGTLGLTYNRHGIDASLYYTMQGRRRVGTYRAFGLHTFDEANDSLDLRVQYVTQKFGPTLRFYVLGNNLLKGRSDPNSQFSTGGIGDAPKYYTTGNYLGGRTVTAGISVDF